jgi:hypothetical protein
VSQWSDKSGSGFHATQVTGTQQPIWSGNGLLFSGLQNMKTSAITNFNNWTSDRTIVALVSYGSSAANTILHWGASGSQTRDEQMTVSAGKLLISEDHDTGTPKAYDSTSMSDVGSGMFALYRYKNSATKERTIRFNGGTGAITSSDRTSILVPDGKLYLGYDRDGGGYNIDGSFASNVTLHEVIIFPSALSDDKLKRVEGYLAHKWNQTLKLPVSHPYKLSYPNKIN